MEKVNDLKKQEVLETQNFLTDSIYLGIRSVNWCLKDRDSWLSLDESYKKEDRRKKVNVETAISETDRVKYIDTSSNAVDIVMYTSVSANPSNVNHVMNPAKSNIRNVVYKAVNRELLTNTFDPRRKPDKVANHIERNLKENIQYTLDSSDNNV